MRVLRDEEADTGHRVKIALAIIDKTIHPSDERLRLGEGVTSITINIQRHERPVSPATIDIEPDQQHSDLTIKTIPAGRSGL